MYSRFIKIPQKRSFLLFGPRLTGKSTWLTTHFQNALQIDLLSETNYLRYLSRPELLEQETINFQKKYPGQFILIDEVQRIPALLNEVHRLIEKHKMKFGLSGSSARKLKKGHANLLAGRANEMHLFPMLAIELKESFELNHAIQWGTLPAVVMAETDEKKQILKSYASVYLREEIQAEGFVRNLPAFSRSLQLSAETIGQEVNFSNLSKETGVAGKTIAGYYSILEDTLIGFFLHPWSYTIRKELAGSSKFYFFDNGVTNSLRQNLSDFPTGDVFGSLFEQFIVQQVKAILSYLEFEGSISYWRARGGKEVDLIISRGATPLLAVEIKSTQNPGLSDFTGLISFNEEYPKTPGIVVSRQPRATQVKQYEGIPYLEFFERLWKKEWL